MFLLGGRIVRAANANNNMDNNNDEGPVAEPPQDAEAIQVGGARGLVGSLFSFIADIIYLLGSFVLSILPMWRPQAAHAAPPPGGAAAAEQEEQEENNGDEGRPQQEDHHRNPHGPGQVRPPRDPAADDNDD